MISEELFANEEARLGKNVHFHDGIWWVMTAPYYYKPVYEFRPFSPKSIRPQRRKAISGFSHQVPNQHMATRQVVWNILEGDKLTNFSMEMLKPAKRRAVRKGQKDCVVDTFQPTDANLEQMRLANIDLAERCEGVRDPGTFLPADYYTAHIAKWREGIMKLFRHQGHQFVGAFADNKLAAYIDLIKIEDTWIFSAIKSLTESLPHRPVDALYFFILTKASLASHSGECTRVLNGGGDDELASLARFKADYMLLPSSIPYYTQSFLPIDSLRRMKKLLRIGRLPNKAVGVSAMPVDVGLV